MKNKIWTKTWSKIKEKEGFTLIEMIIVVAIIAILITLITPNLQKFIETSNKTKTDATAKTLYTSIATYLVDKTVNGKGIPEDTYDFAEVKDWEDFGEYKPEDLNDEIKIEVKIGEGNIIEGIAVKDNGLISTYPATYEPVNSEFKKTKE